jgi:hypothetical protein
MSGQPCFKTHRVSASRYVPGLHKPADNAAHPQPLRARRFNTALATRTAQGRDM